MTAEFERRFGGLRRLYGVQGAERLFASHVVVVGVGGVGSWAAEALARSGLRRITLVDMDHVAESNVNRQVHALSSTLGQSKILAMRERIAQIHPGCEVQLIDDFVTPQNWTALADRFLAEGERLGVIDACDQVASKTAMAAWAIEKRQNFVVVGAAGGKRLAQAMEVADLSEVTHDPLLAQVRYRLRKFHGASRTKRMGVRCVFSREAVATPDASCQQGTRDGSLNCHGYGSVAAVTASFGMCAAGEMLQRLSSD